MASAAPSTSFRGYALRCYQAPCRKVRSKLSSWAVLDSLGYPLHLVSGIRLPLLPNALQPVPLKADDEVDIEWPLLPLPLRSRDTLLLPPYPVRICVVRSVYVACTEWPSPSDVS